MDDEQQARLARLAARGRATASPPQQRNDATTAPTAMAEHAGPSPLWPPPRPVDNANARPGGQPPSTEPARRGRRRHTAVAGRILVAGVATSAFIGGLAALAAAPPPAWEQNATTQGTTTGQPAADTEHADTTPADATPAGPAPDVAPLPPVQDTIYVVQIVPHRVYVDEDGNPTDPNAPGAESPAGDDPDAAASAPAATPRAAAPQSPPAVAAPGEPKATAPSPAPTPAPTAAPKPTSPPTTKPACAGSKCA